MNIKPAIGTMMIDNKLLYNFADVMEALDFKSHEATLQNITASSVYTIENGDPNAKKLLYIDTKALYELFANCPHPLLSVSHNHDYNFVVPKCMKDNWGANGIMYYPAQVVLNITVNADSEMNTASDVHEEYLYSISEIAEEYGMTARKLNLFLEMKGIQHRKGTRWCVYKKYKKLVGYKRSENSHMYWTIDGMLFISSLLKAEGYRKEGV